jgi:predicted DsbA family dithiol-disulfide isomerase
MTKKLSIQIWSDIMCPFCYIGKRKLEGALEKFGKKDQIEIEWKSFELDPYFKYNPNENLAEHLAKKYGKDIKWAKDMMANMTQTAKEAGLDFHFEKAIRANSHDAHRLLHLAKQHQLGNALKEVFLRAYLTDGKDLNNHAVLSELAQQTGLPKQAVEDVLNSQTYSNDVHNDIAIAQQIGVQGVPFFVLDNKYAISGAQPEEVFTQTLQKVWEEGSFETTLLNTDTPTSNSCSIEGCD